MGEFQKCIILKKDIDASTELKTVIAMINVQKHCSGDMNKFKELFPDLDVSELENGNFSENLVNKMLKIRSLGRNADRICQND